MGDTVFVIPLGRTGQVEKCLRDGGYRVQVGNIHINCAENQVKDAPQICTSRADDLPKPSSISITSDASNSPASLRVLDLHGHTVVEAKAKVEEHISRSVLANLSEIEIMHGIGSGALKRAVHEQLALIPAVKRFETKQFNAGVTRVFL